MNSSQAVGHPARVGLLGQQVNGVTIANGSFAQAGGNITIQNHFHGHTAPSVTISEILRRIPNMRKIHLDILSKATTGTGIWVLKTKKFVLWLDPMSGFKILWGTGIPGAGKTVLASIVIDELEARAAVANGYICVAYIYFRYNEATSEVTVRDVLEMLIKQTVERVQACAWLAEQAYARHLSEGTEPTEAELLQLLHQFAEVTSATYYILDALDEAPARLQVDLVKKLSLLKAQLFITSRPLQAVKARFPDALSFAIMARAGDLDLHINQEISRSRELQDLLEDSGPSFKDEVVFSIKMACGGMFLHASLQLDAISRCTTTQDVLDTLDQFPRNIEVVYQQTWQRICSQDPKNVMLVKTVLVWVLNAARPLKLDELRYAIATSPGTKKFEQRRLAPAAILVTLCCGLIVVDEETKIVRLVHYTARDTLQQRLNESFPNPHSLLASVCITHLSQWGLQDSAFDREEFLAALQSDPLLAYACDAWAIHAGQALQVAEIKQQTANFIANCFAHPCFLLPGHFQSFDLLSPLHIIALYDLPISLLPPSHIRNPNILTRVKRTTSLLLASWLGNVNMVKDLLRLPGVEVNITDSNRCSALLFAARLGHEGVAKLLLTSHGININLVDREGWSPLMKAAHERHETIIRLLISRPEIEVNLVDSTGWSALIDAAHRGYTTVVVLLLSHSKILVNMVNEDGESALMKAAQGGHTTIVSLFLARPEIEVNTIDLDGWVALTFAAFRGHRDIVEALLQQPSIRVNSLSKMGWSPLMVASMQGHAAVISLLLAKPDIRINLVDHEGHSSLMRAASNGHEGIVALLLERPEVQVNLMDEGRKTALMHAARGGHTGVARLLLSRPEIKVNVCDNEGWSEIMFAALKGHEELVALLVVRPEVQVNSMDNRNWSALMNAARFGYQVIVEKLLTHPEIEVNLSGANGQTALMLAAQHGHAGVVDILLAQPDIQVDVADDDGHTALVKAAREGHEGIVSNILSHPQCHHKVDDSLLEMAESMLEVGWIFDREVEDGGLSDAYSSSDSECYHDADEGPE